MKIWLAACLIAVVAFGCGQNQRGPRFEIKETDTTLRIYETDEDTLLATLELSLVEPGYPHEPGVSEWEGPFGDYGRVLKIEALGMTMTHESEGLMPLEIPITPEDRLGEKAAPMNAFVQSPEVSTALARWHVTFSTLPVIAPAPEPEGERPYYSCSFSMGGNCPGTSQSAPNCCQSGYGYWTNSNGEDRCCPGSQTWVERACNTACGAQDSSGGCPNLPQTGASNCFPCPGSPGQCCRDHYTYGRQGPNGCVVAASYNLAGPNYLCNIRDNPNPYYCMITICGPDGASCGSNADCCYADCWQNFWGNYTCGGI